MGFISVRKPGDYFMKLSQRPTERERQRETESKRDRERERARRQESKRDIDRENKPPISFSKSL